MLRLTAIARVVSIVGYDLVEASGGDLDLLRPAELIELIVGAVRGRRVA